jgi:hypothetical protein
MVPHGTPEMTGKPRRRFTGKVHRGNIGDRCSELGVAAHETGHTSGTRASRLRRHIYSVMVWSPGKMSHFINFGIFIKSFSVQK